MALVNRGINPISFPGLKLAITSDESKMINFENTPKVIISASGMCEAGRIRHHLKHNLWRPECTILFVGYQAVGTLGRTLLEGASSVKLFGELIDVKAKIMKLDGVSGHADKEGLVKWISSFEPKPEKVYVVHGEDKVCEIFQVNQVKISIANVENNKLTKRYQQYIGNSRIMLDFDKNKKLLEDYYRWLDSRRK